MAWTLFVLAQNQEVQTRVRDEINSLVPPDSDTVQVEHLDKMEYLGCVIKETLRFEYLPIFHFIARDLGNTYGLWHRYFVIFYEPKLNRSVFI